MIGLEVGEARIWVRPGPTDMRKQINGLAVVVESLMSLSPFEAGLFLFCNAERRILKALYWDRTGFCLWMLWKAFHNIHYVERDVMRRSRKTQPGAAGNPTEQAFWLRITCGRR